MTDLAIRGVEAADRINRGNRDDIVDAEVVPVNVGLFGDSPDGNRFRYGVEVTWIGGEEDQSGSFLVWVESATDMSLEDIMEAAEGLVGDIIGQYPERIGGLGVDDVGLAAQDVIIVERRY